MPILLTTPITHDPGHGAVVEVYAHVKIIDVRDRVVKRVLILTLQYGNKVDGVWTGGKTHSRIIRMENIDPQPGPPPVPADPVYDDFMANTFPTSTSIQLRDENAAALYMWLLNTDDPNQTPGEKYYEGTVV